MTLKILVVEDSSTDLELLLRELKRGGLVFESRCVQERDDFLRELGGYQPDLVISDFALPQFDGLSALRLCRERNTELPFIFVSGTIGEETAVEVLKKGATDYLVKGQLKRLCSAVTRAVDEARDRKERQKLEAQLVQAQKMEAIGQLAGGVAHDFNNLLTAVLGYADVALNRLPEGDPVAEDLKQIRKAGERATELTRQLLTFSRKQVISPRVIDLNVAVKGMESLLRRLIGEDVELATALSQDIGRVKIDPGQVEQVIMNLVVNSRDAMPDGGKVTIETANAELDEAYAQHHVGVVPGRYVMFAVSDTGFGMDQGTMTKIFEPFFTTKEQGKGTGLGLATVYGIVKQNHGSIWVYSEPRQGATFKIYLPRVDEPLSAPKSTEVKSTRGGNEVILLVEDEAMVRELASFVLKQNGYQVLEASNGVEALKVAEQRAGQIRLVITDVIMPQMGGRELATKLKQAQPAVKILFISGYTGNTISQQGVLDPGVAFLQKPFTVLSLAQKVRELLDGK